MAAPFIGEIRMFAGTFAPVGWMFCDGSVLAISENEALFNLIGTTYGGDGQQTFIIPDLRGRVPMHAPGAPGQTSGQEQIVLTVPQMPAHGHTVLGITDSATERDPRGAFYASPERALYGTSAGGVSGIAPSFVKPAGGGEAHDNMQPFLCVSFIISLFGIYPSQS